MFCRYPPGSPGPISAGRCAFSVVYTTNTLSSPRFFTVQPALLPRGELTPGSLIDQLHRTQKAGSSLNTRPKASSAALSFSYALRGAALYPSEAVALHSTRQRQMLHRWEWTHAELLLGPPYWWVLLWLILWEFCKCMQRVLIGCTSLPPTIPQRHGLHFLGGGFILIYS